MKSLICMKFCYIFIAFQIELCFLEGSNNIPINTTGHKTKIAFTYIFTYIFHHRPQVAKKSPMVILRRKMLSKGWKIIKNSVSVKW